LHLTLRLVAAAGCLWLFSGLAEDVVTNDPLVRFDRAVADYMHASATPALTTFFLTVTAFGSIEAVALLGVHYFSDVAAGGLWLSALVTAAETIRRAKHQSRLPLPADLR